MPKCKYDFGKNYKVEKYPHRIKIKIRQLINFLAGKLPQKYLSIIMVGSYAIMFFCLLIGTIGLINSDVFPKETVDMVVIFTALPTTIGIIKLIISFIGKDLLYTKENLEELKILFNKKGAKTGSEAFTKDKGE